MHRPRPNFNFDHFNTLEVWAQRLDFGLWLQYGVNVCEENLEKYFKLPSWYLQKIYNHHLDPFPLSVIQSSMQKTHFTLLLCLHVWRSRGRWGLFRYVQRWSCTYSSLRGQSPTWPKEWRHIDGRLACLQQFLHGDLLLFLLRIRSNDGEGYQNIKDTQVLEVPARLPSIPPVPLNSFVLVLYPQCLV